MKIFCKYGLILLCGLIGALLLGAMLIVFLGMDIATILEKMNSQKALYLFPIIIFIEFCFFLNDSFVLLSRTKNVDFGIEFSEMRFTYDLDNFDTPIPLRAKLLQLYPLTICLTALGFVLALN